MNIYVQHVDYSIDSQGSYEVAQKRKFSVPIPLKEIYRMIAVSAKQSRWTVPLKWYCWIDNNIESLVV
jgi:hypothetical protein